jgi:hypothetical protein
MRNHCGYDDKRWPETLPNDWVFPVPPVCTVYWTPRDWVRYAAPYNKAKWETDDGN